MIAIVFIHIILNMCIYTVILPDKLISIFISFDVSQINWTSFNGGSLYTVDIESFLIERILLQISLLQKQVAT